MENPISISIQALASNITTYLTGSTCKNNLIIKANSNNLSENGELYFLLSLKAWKRILKNTNPCNENCMTILQHCLHVHGSNIDDKKHEDIANEVFQSLISSSKSWSIKLEKCSLQKEKVCLFLTQTPLVTNAIKTVIDNGGNYGRYLTATEVFSLKSYHDNESELTTARLHLIRNVTEKILHLHGYKISDEDATFRYVFTTKSEGEEEVDYKKYLCGVVKNSECNTKETSLTWDEYICSKTKELEILNDHKYFELQECNTRKQTFLKDIAQAVATFELLTVKPSRPVFIGQNSAADRNMTNTKGASFVLYNMARIATIIEKYNDKKVKGEYPALASIDDVDFSLLKEEEEWELVYNFILGYHEMINDCFTCEPVFQTNPQVICLFLSRLCQKFSVYYRRIRILTEAYDHLIPTMTARLYMLNALQIILQNTLSLLAINPVSRM